MPCCAPLWAFPLSLSNLGRSSSLSHGKIITVKNKKFCCCFDLDRNPMTAVPDPQTLKIQKFFIENVQVQVVKMNWEKIKNNPNLSKKLFSYFQKCYFSIDLFFSYQGSAKITPFCENWLRYSEHRGHAHLVVPHHMNICDCRTKAPPSNMFPRGGEGTK